MVRKLFNVRMDNMQSLQQQRGATFVFWVFFLALISFIGTLGIKLAPVYMRGFSAEKVIEDLALDMAGKNPNKKQLWETIDKRLYINNISDVTKENMVFNKNRDTIEFGIDYEVRVPLIANMDAVVMFDHRQTITSKKR